ncbi:unnamed protein product, partial [Polarella glacialis]
MSLSYRGTFIHLQSDSPRGGSSRSGSAPPRVKHDETATEFPVPSLDCTPYLTSLERRANQLEFYSDRSSNHNSGSSNGSDQHISSWSEDVTCPRDARTPPLVSSTGGPPPAAVENDGSLGHPQLCRRPCIFFTTGHCAAASACGFCHYRHDQRVPHLDRRNRDTLSKMQPGLRLALLIPVLERRLVASGLIQHSGDLLDLLGQIVASDPQPREPAQKPDREVSRLKSAMRKLPVSSILAWAAIGKHRCPPSPDATSPAMESNVDESKDNRGEFGDEDPWLHGYGAELLAAIALLRTRSTRPDQVASRKNPDGSPN